mgnify:CR=1 FL=1
MKDILEGFVWGWLVFVGLLLGVILIWLFTANLKPDTQGIIHHPIYGDYLAEVPFERGMTIRPGQSAIIVPGPVGKEFKSRYELGNPAFRGLDTRPPPE